MSLKKLRKLYRSGPTNWLMAMEIFLLTVITHVGFGSVGVNRTCSILAFWAGVVVKDPDSSASIVIARVMRIQLAIQSTLPPAGTCLSRSLVLKAILARRGILTELRIGVRKMGSATEGHAWLEYQGAPIQESREEIATYVIFEGASALDSLRLFQ